MKTLLIVALVLFLTGCGGCSKSGQRAKLFRVITKEGVTLSIVDPLLAGRYHTGESVMIKRVRGVWEIDESLEFSKDTLVMYYKSILLPYKKVTVL